MGAPAHLAHQALLLDLAPKFTQRLLEFLGVFHDDLQAVLTVRQDTWGLPSGADIG
jgi:hypothetical protein